MFKNH